MMFSKSYKVESDPIQFYGQIQTDLNQTTGKWEGKVRFEPEGAWQSVGNQFASESTAVDSALAIVKERYATLGPQFEGWLKESAAQFGR